MTVARKLIAPAALGVLLLVGLAEAAPAQSLTFSKERLARIDQAMRSWADEGKLAGAVGLVLRHGKVAYQGAFGWADKEAGAKLKTDAMFRIASQTKAVTSVAVMMLYEEGKIGLGDLVSRWMPTFANTTVAVKADTGRSIVPAKRPITIRDLLTHTSGYSYGTDSLVAPLYQAQGLGPAAGFGWYTADKDEPICTSMDRVGTLPAVAQPGDAFVYGYNTDILGCVVERIAGMPLDQFFAQRIFGPAGMPDTYFFVPTEKAGRLAAVYRPGAGGALVKADEGARGQGHYVVGPRKSFAGGAGLVSTAHDYARFLQMLLNGGVIDGHRLLSPTTVRLMTTNMVGTRLSPDGLGFGLGFLTVDRAGAGNNPHSVGSFGWGGAYQTDYKVDPVQDLVIVMMTQNLPRIPLDLAGRFGTLVYQALVPAVPSRAH